MVSGEDRGMHLTVAVTTFVPLLLLELPDKTFIATLVLATRYKPLLAWIGVGLAFGVQCLLAVTIGGLVARLPATPVAVIAAVLFAVGAVVLWRGARSAEAAEAEAERKVTGRIRPGVHGWRAIAASFVVVFLAEWGDLSQLFTAGLAARYDDPVSVFVGAFAALLVVSGLAVLVGRALLQRLRPSTLRRAGAVVCALLAALTVADVAGVPLPG
jgi:putative Ca2+/H+ antiporter (TMEM165/GDT1 family)